MPTLEEILETLKSVGGSTPLWYDASWGLEVAAGNYGGTIQGLTIGSDNGKKQSYVFSGLGMGKSIGGGKKSGSVSHESFKAFGTNVWKGTFAWGAVDFDSLEGLGHIITISAAVLGSGKCVSLVIFNETVDFLLFNSFMVVAGEELGTTGAGIMCYKGIFKKK